MFCREDEDVLTHLEARTQLCHKCTLEEFKKWKDVPQKIDQKLVDFIPATSEALTVSEKKQPEQAVNSQWRIAARTRFHIETALRLQAQYDKLQTTKEKAKWLEEQRATWNSIDEHADLCREFVRGDMPKTLAEAFLFISQRKARIRQEMIDLGYKDEFELCGMFSPEEVPLGETTYLHICTAEKLTEKGWQSIKGPIITYMEQVRAALLAVRKADRLHDRVVALLTPPYTAYICMRPATVSCLPSLKQLALTNVFKPHLPLDDDEPGNDIQTEDLQEAIEQIPEIMQDYSRAIEEQLLSVVRRAPAYHGKTIDREALFYATTMFQCTTCEESFAFPDAHFYKADLPSKRQRPAGTNKGNAEVDVVAEDGIEARIQRAFKGDMIWAPGRRLRFNEAAYHHSLIVLNSLQMDPLTTSQGLRDLNPYVELLCKCRSRSLDDSKHNRLVNRWTEVVQIVCLHRSMEYGDALRVFDEVDVQNVPGYQARATPALSWCTWTICPFCGRSMDDSSHLTQKHNLSQTEAATVFQDTHKEWYCGIYRALTLT